MTTANTTNKPFMIEKWRVYEHKARAGRFLEKLMRTNPELFAHWRLARDRRVCLMGAQ
jgi:hypothetical protein